MITHRIFAVDKYTTGESPNDDGVSIIAGNRNSFFDSLKGIAILSIMIIHFCNWYGLVNILPHFWVRFINKGDYGVEITFIINAILLTYSFNKHYFVNKQSMISFILSQFKKIIFIYYFAILVKLLLEYIINHQLAWSIGDYITHFFFINTISCKFFNSLFGGSGYIGVLAIMWIVYPIILRFIRNNKSYSFIVNSIVFAVCYQIYYLVLQYNLVNTECIFEFQYFSRAIIGYSIGNILSWLLKDKSSLLGKKVVWFVTSFTLILIATMIWFGHDNFFNIILLIGLIIYVNFKESIIIVDNCVFAFWGKHIFSIFISHILIFYFFKIIGFELTTKVAIINLLLIIPIAFVLERFVDKPMQKILFNLPYLRLTPMHRF